MKKQTNRNVFKTIIICLMLFSLYINSVSAEEKIGSISLYSHYIDDGKVIQIADTTFQVVKVADVVDGKFVNVTDFINFKDIPTMMNASQMKDISYELQTYMKNYGVSFSYEKNTNDNGYIQFEKLDIGLYLLSQKEMENQKYFSEPFLISIPMIENGNELFNVYVEPKFIKKDDVVEEPNIPNVPKDSIYTGDESNMMLWSVLVVGSLFIFIHKRFDC